MYSLLVSLAVSLKPRCADGNSVALDNRSIANEKFTPIPREKNRHRQLVQLTCSSESSYRNRGIGNKNYLLAIFSNFEEKDIPPPRLIIEGRGKECTFSPDLQRYNCPNPRSQDYRTRIVGFIEPSIRYTVESVNKNVGYSEKRVDVGIT